MSKISNRKIAEQALKSIYLEKTTLSVSDMESHTRGKIFDFLLNTNPTHANQAKSFLDALMATIGPISRQTDQCNNFAELCERQGFTKSHLKKNLDDLTTVVDMLNLIDETISDLASEGMKSTTRSKIRTRITSIYTELCNKKTSEMRQNLFYECSSIATSYDPEKPFTPQLENGYNALKQKEDFKHIQKEEIYACMILKILKNCEVQNLSN